MAQDVEENQRSGIISEVGEKLSHKIDTYDAVSANVIISFQKFESDRNSVLNIARITNAVQCHS